MRNFDLFFYIYEDHKKIGKLTHTFEIVEIYNRPKDLKKIVKRLKTDSVSVLEDVKFRRHFFRVVPKVEFESD